MTAPVLMEAATDDQGSDEVPMTMSFVMPGKFTSVDDLPVPKDSRVVLTESELPKPLLDRGSADTDWSL